MDLQRNRFHIVILLGAAAIFGLFLSGVLPDRMPQKGAVTFSSVDISELSLKEFLKYSSIDVNTADQETLMRISGIGEVLSRRIIDYRDAMGGFETLEELMEVKGIGPVRLKAIRRVSYIDY